MSEVLSVCVYCGASSSVPEEYKEAAYQLGTQIAQGGLRLIYGGGNVGLMGITADAALKAGGEAVGVIPGHLKDVEPQHDNLTELHVVDSMHTRKNKMVELSDAFIVMPGGLGTLDETFEILTWKYLNLHDKAVVIVNIDGYWDPLIRLIDNMIETGFAREDDYRLFSVVNKVEDIFVALLKEPEQHIEPNLERL